MATPEEKLESYDEREWYCPMLGHDLKFSYCRTMQEGLPCRRILDCWYRFLPIQQFMASHYSQQELEKIFGASKSRLDTLLETIDRVTSAVEAEKE